MIWHKKLLLLSLVALSLCVLPAVTVADDDDTSGGGGQDTICDGGLCNPLGSTNDLGALILKIVEGIAQVGYYVVVLFIIYSGFKFVAARGNDTKLKDAKQTFLFTIIGAAILLGATLLANVISGTVDQLKTSSVVEHQSLISNTV